MNIMNLINEGASNIQLTVTAADLQEFALAIIDKVQQEQNDTLLSRSTVLELLGVNVTTLCRWDSTGYLRPVRIGRKCFYRRSDINHLIQMKDAAQD